MTDREEDIGRMALNAADSALWRRSCAADAPEDEADAFLDLAGFADGLLGDDDESERVAARLARDADAGADIAAARALSAAASPPVALDRVIDRALLLVPPAPARRVIPFALGLRPRLLPQAAQWASLAAAIVFASWLGFAMGNDFSLDYSQAVQPAGDDGSLPELLDPSTGGLLHDFAEDMQT
jgi:hypothetical protein